MRRVLASIALLGVCSLTLVAAVQQPPPPKVIEVEKLRDNLFVLKGGGGNTAVFVRAGDVVVVDTKNPGWGRTVLDTIKGLTAKPVTTVINTHAGGDHVSGNVEFPAALEFVTHENTKANMEGMTIFKESGGRGLPTRTFRDRLSLGSGSDRIDLYNFGTGHTNGDVWVVFPGLRVLHAGDNFGFKNLPRIDTVNHGSAVAFPDNLARALDAITNVDTVIPGHDTQMMTLDDLRQLAFFNREFLTTVQEAKTAGKSVDDVASTWKIPARYAGFGPLQQERLRTNVQLIFDELQR